MNFTDTMAIYDRHWDKTYPTGSADRIEQAEVANRVGNVFVPLGLVVAQEQPGTRKSKYVVNNPLLEWAKGLNEFYAAHGMNDSHVNELHTLAATLRSGVVEV